MSAWKLFRMNSSNFFKHWGQLIALTFLLNAFISYVLIPIFTWLVSELLKFGHVPYLSNNNILDVIVHAPLVAVGLLVIIAMILLAVYGQFTTLVIGIHIISRNEHLKIGQLVRETLKRMFATRVSLFLFFLLYFLLISPFGGVIFTTSLLSHVQIPGFIMEYILTQPWLLVTYVVVTIVAFYLGMRLIAVLPLMILDRMKFQAAFVQSWRVTRRQLWHFIAKFLWVVLPLALFTIIAYGLIVGEQGLFDEFANHIALPAAVINMGLMEIVAQLTLAYGTVMLLQIAIQSRYQFDPEKIKVSITDAPLSRGKKRTIRWFTGATLVILVSLNIFANVVYLDGLVLTDPITISHRGVDDGNGVQNTIPALEKTAKEKPDYVEMDIHQTKDNQFVVMHDENLKALAGVNKAPYQLTLAQLQKITVRENGHSAKIPSFDAYFNAAIKAHQKLLIEIKTTKHDSKNLVPQFIQRYKAKILAHHDRIHSLDYNVVAKLKKQAPSLYVSFILPFNFTFPETKANAYTMESTSLTYDFIQKAHARHQDVFAWTVNDTDGMDRMMFAGADGIITDDLTQLKEEIKTNFDHPTYASRLLSFITQLDTENSVSN